MFSWKPIYKEIAGRVLQFENRQSELLDLLKKFQKQNLAVILLTDYVDRSKPAIQLSEIDPFTFFANFNRPITDGKRLALLKAIKEEWHLDAPVPSDFLGIPLAPLQNAWFFAYASKRQKEDVSKLWALAREAVQKTRQTFRKATLDEALTVRQVGLSKATMGMFWLNPEEFLSTDSHNRAYFRAKGVELSGEAAEDYFAWLNSIRTQFSEDFAVLSNAAYSAKNPATSSSQLELKEESRPARYWTLSAGTNGDQWNDFVDNDMIAIGWDGTPDLQTLGSQEEVRKCLKKLFPGESSRKNSVLACWQFAKEMKPGDIVFVKQGFQKLLGVARVVGDYTFDASRSSYRHVRQVQWIAKGEWVLKDDSRMALKALTDITRYPEFVEKLKKVAGVEADAPLVASAKPVGRQYWWLNANPKIWDFSRMKVGNRQTYTTHNESGNKRRIYQYFTQVKPDDVVIGYITAPEKEITGLAKITKALHKASGQERIEFEKTEQFANAISYEELRDNPALSNCEPLINNQGSLFKMTESEFEIIRSLVDEKNPPSTVTLTPYTKEDALRDLFVSPDQFEEMLRALHEKRNLLLQGPPGVGKTFVAERLAYALIGQNDAQRVGKVQFHQSYSYEDFIQGFRPTPKGQFELKNGIFHQFCRRAQRDPEQRAHVFVIDEINRGNLSKIFGELLLLIEPDKRGEKHAIPLTYSSSLDETFFVPENVFLIGTMNTADRSLALVDYALRRRFRFISLRPEFTNGRFEKHLKTRGATPGLIKCIVDRITALNQAITNDEKNLGEGYQIGHSYFCPQNGAVLNESWYRAVIKSEIAPLLEEYWFDESKQLNAAISALLAP